MLTPWDHALALVLVLLFPIRARMVLKGRLARASLPELPEARRAAFRQAMAVQWSLTATAALIWILLRRPWRELGLVPVLTGGLIGILVGLAVVAFIILRQSSRAVMDDVAAEKLRNRTRKLERMMPRSPGDLRVFSGLAVTAGICEEVLYRGYLIFYLTTLGLALVPAAAIASLVFGFGHLYQGLRGMISTAIVGGFLAAVYLLSGSLFAGMIIHVLMDLHAGRLLQQAWSRTPGEAASMEATA